MQPISADDLAAKIVEFLRTGDNPALFAGAGVGIRAGLPGWAQYMEHLAAVAEIYDEAEAEVIRRRASAGHYLSAAQAYKSCPALPEGEKFKQLALPFEDPPEPQKLNALVSLPFSAIFTTNYDRSLHHAYADVFGRDAKSVELADPTMDRAPYDLGFYVARVHGRAEVPETMVLDENDYVQTQTSSYLDFLSNCLTRYRCLFVGFSFLDPAIARVFEVIRERLAPAFPQLHSAILPADANADFLGSLEEFNITALFYDAGLDHEQLWEGIAEASRQFTLEEKQDKPKALIPFAPTRRYLAAAYTRTKLNTELLPLRDVVVDGIIVDLLTNSDEGKLSLVAVASELKKILTLSLDECEVIADSRTRYLAGVGICSIEGSSIVITAQEESVLDEDLGILVDGAINRLFVRHAIDSNSEIANNMATIIETTLLSRGWDLGASYVGADPIEEVDLRPTLRAIIESVAPEESLEKREAIALACLDLLTNSDESEGEVLARFGRISFALHLILNTPSGLYTHEVLLPERVFLDSNVLMRAIVDGHPMQPLYIDSLRRLKEASDEAELSISILVLPGFLNEVIAHREIAIREVDELRLENHDELRHHLVYYGTERVNVFVAAYASWVGRTGEVVGFNEFLARAAPYTDQKSLTKYLMKMGISSQSQSPGSEFVATFGPIHSALEDAYEQDPRSRFDPKQPVLIFNEARQLAYLEIDRAQGIRSLFVSGDLRLQRFCEGAVLGVLRESILGNRRFVQLVDLLLGLRTDPSSVARLLWGSTPTDESLLILNYYTDLALQQYHHDQAKILPRILSGFVPEVIEGAKRDSISLFPGGSLESKAIKAKFLDRFEDRFYELMAEAIRDIEEGQS